MPHTDSVPYVRSDLTPLERFRLPPTRVFATLGRAYEAVRRVAETDPRFGAAWKLGGTTAATRTLFRTDQAYFGILHANELLVRPAKAPCLLLCELKGEVEIALRISTSTSQSDPCFDAWCIAFEMPASPIENLVALGVNALVADRCAAGALLLGAPQSMQDLSRSGQAVVLQHDGVVVGQGSTEMLLAPPTDCARGFVEQALRHGFFPEAGQWVATGGLTPCTSLRVGTRVRVLCGESVHHDFTVETE